MEKRRVSHVILVLIVTCGLTFLRVPAAFSAFDFADGRIHITGWYENLTSIRLGDGPNDGVHEVNGAGRIQTLRNTLQVETTVKLIPEVILFGAVRGFYEGSWDLRQSGFDTSAENESSVPRGSRMESDIDVREYHLTARLGAFAIKIGRQQVIWGESDAIRMADIINPLDLSWHWVFESWEDIRIPLRMVNFTFEPPSNYQLRFQLIYIPEDFRTTTFAPPGAVWAIPGVPEVIWKQEKREMHGKYDFGDGQFGERVQGKLGSWDMSLYHFYHRVDSAVYKFNPTHLPLPLEFRWPYVNTTGATFNVFEPFTKTVFRGESAYTIHQPYTSQQSDRIIKKDTFAFMLGFDRPTMINMLNPTKSFFISGQFFYKHIFNSDPDIVTTDMDRRKNQYIITLLVNTNYWNDKITPQMVWGHDFSGKSGNGFVQPSIKYAPSDWWDVTLAANFIYGVKNTDGYFGAVRKSDEVYLRLRFKF